MSKTQAHPDTIVCDLSVFTDQEREQHLQEAHQLFGSVVSASEIETGYALRLPDQPGILQSIAKFIQDDRKCCPFITFTCKVDAYQQGVWLILEGDETAKAVIYHEILGLMPENVWSQ